MVGAGRREQRLNEPNYATPDDITFSMSPQVLHHFELDKFCELLRRPPFGASQVSAVEETKQRTNGM